MKRLEWNDLDAADQRDALARPAQVRAEELEREVTRIVAQVRADGDAALRALTRRYDGCTLGELRVSEAEFVAAQRAVSAELKNAIAEAKARIEFFHRATMT